LCQKDINGCWECTNGLCEKDTLSEHHDVRNRTFVKVAKNEGIEELTAYVLENQKNGIMYGWNKDYDNSGNEEAVIDLLHKGLNCRYAKNNNLKFSEVQFIINQNLWRIIWNVF